ncbi:MAG: hypothetical protein AAF702_46280 [Chloroflexota bacterium]
MLILNFTMRILSTWRHVCSLLDREEGQDLAEYAMILVLVVVVVAAAVVTLGSTLFELYWGPISTMFNE